ncbi:MAG: arsenate reductase ArsC [Methanosarcinaceae archaeon]|nr:arsenate reductase ArsC [Methanosarcinaceae archaeon]
MVKNEEAATDTGSREKKKVLFLCFHNSARSQMAEALLRSMYGDRYDAYSAGVEASMVNPCAVQVMKEIGIDISGQRSKSLKEYQDDIFDLMVTVCDRAKQACPVCSTPDISALGSPVKYPEAKEMIHRNFEDPASVEGSRDEQLNVFRRVRDEIKDWISFSLGG